MALSDADKLFHIGLLFISISSNLAWGKLAEYRLALGLVEQAKVSELTMNQLLHPRLARYLVTGTW